jgi:pimeloyl-ACP methyl ester carboxylesterase
MSRKILFLALCLLVLISCSPVATDEPIDTATETFAPADTPQPTATKPPAQSTEPQRVEFNAKDGTALIGYHFAAPNSNSPVVVLMHWANGDQQEWVDIGIVDWLTHKNLNGFADQFPSTPYSVFTFDFRGFGESGGQFNPAGWLLDAKAAYETAMSLAGVDPTKIIGIGSSIGADAVVNACGTLCKGALSLSPGGYLGVPYNDAVASLSQNPANRANILCIASEDDRESAPACQSASGERYQSIVYPESLHGTEFLMPSPTRLEITKTISEWLSVVIP